MIFHIKDIIDKDVDKIHVKCTILFKHFYSKFYFFFIN